ncbi:hypothetical protein [Neisseria zalophi]|nr:hypothetical protein [Neisseria zalophi]
MGRVESKSFFVGLGDSAESVVFELCYAASLVAAMNEAAGFIIAVTALDGSMTRSGFSFAFGSGNGI